jgi:hypothetical protein
MPSFLETFNAITAIEYKRCSELAIDKKYPIESLQNQDTKYGSSVLATIVGWNDQNAKYRVYLPKRYASMFTDEELRHITPLSLNLVYRGKRDQSTLVEITK